MSLSFELKVIDLFGGGAAPLQGRSYTCTRVCVSVCRRPPRVNLCAHRPVRGRCPPAQMCAAFVSSQSFRMAQYLCVNIRRGCDCQFIRGDKWRNLCRADGETRPFGPVRPVWAYAPGAGRLLAWRSLNKQTHTGMRAPPVSVLKLIQLDILD